MDSSVLHSLLLLLYVVRVCMSCGHNLYVVNYYSIVDLYLYIKCMTVIHKKMQLLTCFISGDYIVKYGFLWNKINCIEQFYCLLFVEYVYKIFLHNLYYNYIPTYTNHINYMNYKQIVKLIMTHAMVRVATLQQKCHSDRKR